MADQLETLAILTAAERPLSTIEITHRLYLGEYESITEKRNHNSVYNRLRALKKAKFAVNYYGMVNDKRVAYWYLSEKDGEFSHLREKSNSIPDQGNNLSKEHNTEDRADGNTIFCPENYERIECPDDRL